MAFFPPKEYSMRWNRQH